MQKRSYRHWDDHDWYAERRLQYQVDALIGEPIDVCGINNLLYYDLRNKLAYRYVYPANQRTWLFGQLPVLTRNCGTEIGLRNKCWAWMACSSGEPLLNG